MIKTIGDLTVTGLRVLVRADLNVPLDGGRVTDDGRIRASLPTLVALSNRRAKVIICGRAYTVLGGGDTGAAIRTLGYPDSAFGYISTGGGAGLEFLQGKALPGLVALEQLDQ